LKSQFVELTNTEILQLKQNIEVGDGDLHPDLMMSNLDPQIIATEISDMFRHLLIKL